MKTENLMQQGIQAIEEGSLDLAIQKFLEALSIVKINGDRFREANILKHIINVYLQQGNYALAEATAKKFLEMARQLTNRSLICQSLNNLGLSYYWQERYSEAINCYQEALNYLEKGSDYNWKIWNNLGEAYYWQENYVQALESHQQALKFAASDRAKSITLSNLGQTQYWSGNHREAIAYLEQSLELTEDNRQKIGVLSALGQVYFSSHQWQQAEEIYQELLKLAKKIGDSERIISVLDFLAQIQFQLGNFADSKTSASEAMTIADSMAESQEQSYQLAVALRNRGSALSGLSDLDGAIKAHERSLAILKKLENTQQEEKVALMALGLLYEQLGSYTKAIDYFEQTYFLAELTNDVSVAQLSRKNIGQIYVSLGYYQLAIANFLECLKLAQQDGNPLTDIEAYQRLGDAYHASGDFKKAITNYQTALSLAQEANDLSQKIQALSNLVSGYRALQNYLQAIEYAEQIIVLSRAEKYDEPMIVGAAWLEFIALQLLIGDSQAIDSCQQLLTLCQQTNAYPPYLALQRLGETYSHFGNHDQALEYLHQALELVETKQDRQSEGEILNSLGQAYFKAQNCAAASETLRQAIAVWEDLRTTLADRDEFKIPLLTKQRKTYQLLQTVLVSQEKYLEALEVSELGRARSLADILNWRSPKASHKNEPVKPIQSAEIIEIAKTLGVTLVEYGETLEALYIWVIQPSGAVHFEQVPIVNPYAVMTETATGAYQPNELSLAIQQIRSAMNLPGDLLRTGMPINISTDSLRQQNKKSLNTALTEVYKFLIEPIAKYLPKHPEERIILIPQGYLFNVPFPALIDKLGFYLIEKQTISTAPSIQVLRSISQLDRSHNISASDTALVVGNPVMPKLPGESGYFLPDLPGAEQEANKVAEIFDVSPLIGSEATKAKVVERMKTVSMIHLATHGLLDYKTTEGSFEREIPGAVALAPDRDREQAEVGDGLLTSNEIINMSLQAELTVLSACHTGRGEITADGVIGLSRAFITAGVSSVLVSLWAIPDDYTVTLMENFYNQIKQSNDLARSLRQAMLTAIRNNQHPINWAAFTLIGW